MAATNNDDNISLNYIHARDLYVTLRIAICISVSHSRSIQLDLFYHATNRLISFPSTRELTYLLYKFSSPKFLISLFLTSTLPNILNRRQRLRPDRSVFGCVFLGNVQQELNVIISHFKMFALHFLVVFGNDFPCAQTKSIHLYVCPYVLCISSNVVCLID